MKNRKSPVPGDILVELLKNATEIVFEIMTNMFNKCPINGKKTQNSGN